MSFNSHFNKQAREVKDSKNKSSFFNVRWYHRYPIWNSKTLKNISGFKTGFEETYTEFSQYIQ